MRALLPAILPPMKPANPAPFYACLYPALCDRAREHGYALAIHGTVATDLDLIAVPWTTAATAPSNPTAAKPGTSTSSTAAKSISP